MSEEDEHPFDRAKRLSMKVGVPAVKYYDEHVLAYWSQTEEHRATVAWLKSVYPGWK